MELTFCIPAKGRVYDLITNGRTTPVTLDRLQEFISLAKEKRKYAHTPHLLYTAKPTHLYREIASEG